MVLVFVIVFLNSMIVPNYVLAMGQSGTIDDSVGWGLLAGFVIVLGILVYYHHKAPEEQKEDKKENKETRYRPDNRIGQAGDFVIIRW